MDLQAQDLDKLARLARLTISDEERQQVLPALNAVLTWVGELGDAPTEGVSPMAHPQNSGLRLREDRTENLPERDALMGNAPQAAEGLFIVPRVVE